LPSRWKLGEQLAVLIPATFREKKRIPVVNHLKKKGEKVSLNEQGAYLILWIRI